MPSPEPQLPLPEMSAAQLAPLPPDARALSSALPGGPAAVPADARLPGDVIAEKQARRLTDRASGTTMLVPRIRM